jgi:hypothetical protein
LGEILKNCGIFSDGYDFSGDHNEINLDLSKEILDKTTFSATRKSKEKTLGLAEAKANGMGFVNLAAAGSDKIFFDQLSLVQKLTSIMPKTQSAGDIVYFMQALRSTYKPGMKVGQLMSFSYDLESYGDIVNGTVLLNSTVSSSGNGTAYNLGQVSASQKLYAGIHVLSVSGTGTPTITGKIQSDNLEGFGSPTDRITFAAKTAIGSEWATPVSGAITDGWWRFNYTISGTNPSFLVLVVMGIQLP